MQATDPMRPSYPLASQEARADLLARQRLGQAAPCPDAQSPIADH
jgi:hypothetical protein